MDSFHAFDFPLDDFAPTQHAALDAALTRESISHEWHGSTLSVDVAYEARVTTLVDQARNQVLPHSPPVTSPQVAAPTAVGGPAYPAADPSYAPGYGYGYNYAYAGYVRPATSNGLAVASLVLGIVSLVLCGSLLTGIPAVICGVMARRQIRESNGTQQGDGMALAGIITGAIASVLTIGIVAFYVVVFLLLATAATTS